MDAEPLFTLDELLAHQGWVRALALSLARPGSEADDLVQDTWLVALEHPPGRGQPLGPWLARVLRNLARRRRRGEARRRAREQRSAAPAPLPTPAELCDRVGLQQELVRLVLSLDEPYRATLLLHYFEELPANEIARREGIPAASVRQRLKRGRERLRELLDRRHDGEREAWIGALLAWAAPEGAGSGDAGAARSPSLATTLAGRLALVLAGVTAIALAVWFAPRHASRVRGAATVASEPRSTTPDNALRAASALTGRRATEEASSGRSAASAANAGALAVHVRRADDSQPVAGEWVWVVTDAPPHPFAEAITAPTDEHGDALFATLPAGGVGIGLQRRGDELDWTTVSAGGTVEVTLELPRGYRVRGEVVDERGAAIPGASVWVGEPWSRLEGHVLATSDASGRFTLSDLRPAGMHWIGAFAPGRAPSELRYIDANPGDEVALHIALERAGGSLRARLVDSAGNGLAGVQVLVGFESPEWASAPGGSPPRRARSEADGSLLVEGVPTGALPVLARAPGFAVAEAEVVVSAARESSVTLTLAPEARVAGRVVDAEGNALAGASVTVLADAPFATPRATSASDGRFELVGLGGRVRLRTQGDAGRDEVELALAAGEAREWNPVLRPIPTISGRLLDAHGAPVAERELTLFEQGPFQRGRVYVTTDARGVFTFGATRSCEHVLMVLGDAPLPELVVRGVRPALETLELRLPDPTATRAFLAGRLLDPDGEPLAGARLGLHHADDDVDGEVLLADDGRFEFALPSGTLELQASAEGQASFVLGRWTLAAGERIDLGSRRFPRAAFVHGVLAGVPESASLRLDWRDSAERDLGRGSLAEALYRSPPLAPGACTLLVQGDGVESREFSFTLEEGTDALRDLELRPAPMRTVELVLPPDAPRPGAFRARARDDERRVCWELAASFAPTGALAFTLSARPGRVRLEVEVDTGLRGEEWVDIADDAEPVPARIELHEP